MSFYLPEGARYVASELTRGPWNNDHQHGGPPAALLTGCMARHGDDAADFAMARVWVELLRPVPITAVHVDVRVERGGRTAQRLYAELSANGEVVMTARGLRLKRTALQLPEPPVDSWPDRNASTPFEFPFFQHDVGYHRGVELRVAHGAWGSTPVGFWARPRVPLIEGRETSPLERLMILADAQSGMGVPLEPMRFSFVNPDLSVHLERPPQGEWFGFDIRSTAGEHGGGLAQSAVRDERGVVARSAQTLVVWAR
ncbi:MAG: thioesterase family protein [Deltaproteobacteria bacterium]|nr:MAG: thioesterase family protein [Deltaproteobacteria bacterium]